jgi:hypothetical protein
MMEAISFSVRSVDFCETTRYSVFKSAINFNVALIPYLNTQAILNHFPRFPIVVQKLCLYLTYLKNLYFQICVTTTRRRSRWYRNYMWNSFFGRHGQVTERDRLTEVTASEIFTLQCREQLRRTDQIIGRLFNCVRTTAVLLCVSYMLTSVWR